MNRGSVDLGEFRSAYLAEAEELLASASTQLLETEPAARGAIPRPLILRALLRTFHTLKGLSAMVGVEPVVALAHHMEGPLRATDRRGGELTLQAIDALLQGVEAARQCLRALAEGRPVPDAPPALLSALDEIQARVAASAPVAAGVLDLDPVLAEKLSELEKQQLLQGAIAGKRALRADFSPSPDRAERGLTINHVRERLSKIAEIVRIIPFGRPQSPAAPSGLTFSLLLLTSASDEAILEVIGGSSDDVSPIPLVRANEGLSLANIPSVQRSAGQAGRAPGPAEAVAAGELDRGMDEPAGASLRQSGVLRVEVGRIDEAVDRLSGLVVTHYRLERCVAELAAAGVQTRHLSEILTEHARQLRDLRAAILQVRMVAVAEILEGVPLIVRGLRREIGKEVDLETEVGAAELDKAVADRIFPAIVQLVRNAVDHAIEPPEEREALGKPRAGKLRIVGSALGDSALELRISDDGRGIDREAVAKLTGREAPQGDVALLELLCRPGFSTRSVATTTSGRGVGLDIVKRIVVGELGGELSLCTAPGAGTTFTLRVPLTISIVDAFTFHCGGERFVVPVAMIEEIVDIDPARVEQTVNAGPLSAHGRAGRVALGLMERRGETMPVIALASALGLGDRGFGGKGLIVHRGGEPMVFAVDRVLGRREAVVRPLKDPLLKTTGVAGATDLGDGRPTLVLDLCALNRAIVSSRRDQ